MRDVDVIGDSSNRNPLLAWSLSQTINSQYTTHQSSSYDRNKDTRQSYKFPDHSSFELVPPQEQRTNLMPWLIVLTSSSGILSPLKVSKLHWVESLNYAGKQTSLSGKLDGTFGRDKHLAKLKNFCMVNLVGTKAFFSEAGKSCANIFAFQNSPLYIALDFCFFLLLFWNPANFPTTREVLCKLAKSKYFSKELEKTFSHSASSYSTAEEEAALRYLA